MIAEVDKKGRTGRLPIKPNVRKALCFPGGSTLMLSRLNNDNQPKSADFSQSTNQLKSHYESANQMIFIDDSEPQVGSGEQKKHGGMY